MDKQHHIKQLQRQIKIGKDLMQVAEQNYNAAALSVSEAQTALNELGAPKGRARKGYQLSDETRLLLKAGLTKAKKP